MKPNIQVIIFVIIFIFSCRENEKSKAEFSTYFIGEGKHEITFYEHYIYLDTILTIKDSLIYVNKILKYADTVKDGRPIIAVSIVKEKFPKSLDDIDWPKVYRSTIFSVEFKEDSLKKGKCVIENVRITP